MCVLTAKSIKECKKFNKKTVQEIEEIDKHNKRALDFVNNLQIINNNGLNTLEHLYSTNILSAEYQNILVVTKLLDYFKNNKCKDLCEAYTL